MYICTWNFILKTPYDMVIYVYLSFLFVTVETLRRGRSHFSQLIFLFNLWFNRDFWREKSLLEYFNKEMHWFLYFLYYLSQLFNLHWLNSSILPYTYYLIIRFIFTYSYYYLIFAKDFVIHFTLFFLTMVETNSCLKNCFSLHWILKEMKSLSLLCYYVWLWDCLL